MGAPFRGLDNKIYIFKGNNYISSDDFSQENQINEFWGKVKSKFTEVDKIDAAYAHDDKVYSDLLVLERPGGELTTVTLDEFSILRKL